MPAGAVASSENPKSVPGGDRARRIGSALAGAAIGLLVFVLYLRTLAPGVMYYDRPLLADAATLQAHAATLGITHPTGYPTWVMLVHLFTYLPFAEEPAYLTNLSSAVLAALAVVATYTAGLLLTRRVVAAAVGALSFGLGATFWSQSVIAEVHSLHALFVALFFSVLLLWRDRRREDHRQDREGSERYLLAAAFLAGLSMTNHMTSAVLVPTGVVFVWLMDRGRLFNPRLALGGAGLFVLGLAPYLYLPIRAAMEPPLREGDPTTLGGFLTHVSGSEVSSTLFGGDIGEVPQRIASYGGSLLSDFNWALLMLGAAGLWYLLSRDRVAVALLGLPCAVWLTYAFLYDIYDLRLYYIPPHLVVALVIAVGVGVLLRVFEYLSAAGSRIPRVAILSCASAAVLTVPLAGLERTYAAVDRSDDYRGREIIEAVADNAEPGATVLHNRSSLWYMLLVEERRRDLTLLDPFIPEPISTYDQVWPAELTPQQAARRYGTDDNTGVEAAQKAAEDGPVYILDQDSADASAFLRAGFEIVPIEEGTLYRLEPGPQQT